MRRIAVLALVLLLIQLDSRVSSQDVSSKRITLDNGIALHYREQGVGDPVVFVHGLASDLTFWSRQVEAFARDGYRAISYSRRYNFPNKNAPQPDHSAKVEADDLAGLIRRLELGQVHLVGHSFGAYSSLLLAIQHPDLVKTVTLAEPPLVPWLDRVEGDLADQAKSHGLKLSRAMDTARTAYASDDARRAMQTMMDCIGGDGTFDRLPSFIQARCLRNGAELEALVSSNGPYPRIEAGEIQTLQVPTLLLSGSDSIATASFTDPILQRLLPKSLTRRVVLQGASHIMWVEQPIQCRREVQALIRSSHGAKP
ncbi:MAG: alpha/beta hydrolase [Planctomycetota bacterium]